MFRKIAWFLAGAILTTAMTPVGVLANYAVTQGSGTTFGSLVVGGFHFAQQLICDATTTSQCTAVDSSGGLSVKGEGVAGTPAGGVLSVQGVSSGTNLNVQGPDPCTQQAKSVADFESTVSGGSIITAASAKKAFICSVSVVTSAAANVSLIEGTGASVCTGGTTAGVFMNIGVTAASGASFAANSGISVGSGQGTIAQNGTVNQNVCLLFTTTNTPQVNAHVTYVQQ